MAGILVLPPLHPARSRREVRVQPLQGLDPGLLVGADEVDALLGQPTRLLVQKCSARKGWPAQPALHL